MSSITVVPAYGRDYKSRNAAIDAWESGKDFRVCDMSSRYDGSYVNASQLSVADTVYIRYAKLTKTVVTNGGRK